MMWEEGCAVLLFPTLVLVLGAMECAVTSEVVATVLLEQSNSMEKDEQNKPQESLNHKLHEHRLAIES